MGFLKFLKPKKGSQKATGIQSKEFPPLPSEHELYSELPNLPEAPETSGMPEIELPQQMKELEELDLPDIKPNSDSNDKWKPSQMPDLKNIEIPELPKLKKDDIKEDRVSAWLNIPAEVPELKPFKEEGEAQPVTQSFSAGLVSQNNSFFLRAEDYRMVRESLDRIARSQKKHHRITELKKEENEHYEKINMLTEEMQRKLMHIDRTLFE